MTLFYAFVDRMSMAKESILKHMKVSSIILTAGLFLTCNVLPEFLHERYLPPMTMTTLSMNDQLENYQYHMIMSLVGRLPRSVVL